MFVEYNQVVNFVNNKFQSMCSYFKYSSIGSDLHNMYSLYTNFQWIVKLNESIVLKFHNAISFIEQ